jgi:two-component system sensor histidine kinase PilS (NtrC family)
VARAGTHPALLADAELRRRIGYLMLFRVVLITVVLGVTVALNLASPEELGAPQQVLLFGVIVVTYSFSLGYAFWLSRVARPLRFADAQLAGDLLFTTFLVHITGGAQSGYTFLYPLSIVGAATVRYRRGAVIVAVASAVLFTVVAVAGWQRLLPSPPGVTPWELGRLGFTRQLFLNLGACAAIGVLAGYLGDELDQSSERAEKQRLRSLDLAALKEDIIRCIPSGLLTVDLAGRVLTCNDAAEDILGVQASQITGRELAELLPELAGVVGVLGEHESLRRGEVRKGALVLGASVAPLVDHADRPIGRIVSFSDLTELRRMEEQVKHAERLAVIGGVAAAVAHEIRNPLASISGSIELLRSSPEAARAGESQQLMDIVVREVDRLNRLVTDLLDYARPRARLAVEMDLGEALAETARVFAQDRTGAAASATLALDAPAPALVVADPAQLRQVVWNLLRNAAEAMPGGGTVTARLRSDGDHAVLTVADTGVGIAPEDLEHIFEPFYTTKPSGSGLGLPLVHRIVTDHGGTVAVDSTAGRGTTVTVTLPAARPRP